MRRCQTRVAGFFIPVLFLFLIPLTEYASGDQAFSPKPVSFSWAIAAQVANGNVQNIIPVSPQTALRSGDKIKIYLRIEAGCYVYAVYRSSSNAFLVLFPDKREMLDISPRTVDSHYLPPADQWFELDDQTGVETFYLIASTLRLPGLEKLLIAHGNAPTQSKNRIKDEITALIEKMSRQSNQLTVAAEKPIRMTGSMRSEDEIGTPGFAGIKPQRVQIGPKECFVKTYRIIHHSR